MNTIAKPPVKTPNKAPEKLPETSGHSRSAARSMFDPAIVMPAIADSFRKLAPRTQLRNPTLAAS
jgi:K+-transporting ATPase ATPase B chain